MTTLPRRSARLSQRAEHHQFSPPPPLSSSSSHTSSSSSTSYPSPVDDFITIPAQPRPHFHHLSTQYPIFGASIAAPLPSPSASDIEPFFDRSAFTYHSGGITMGVDQHGQTSNNNASQSSSGQIALQAQKPHTHSQAHHHHHNSFSSQSAQRPAFGAHQHADNSLPPPDLLAEAAKRAQMACLMRDLGDVAL